MHPLLRGRGFHDPQLITSRSDSAPAQQFGDGFAIDPLAEVIVLRALETRNFACALRTNAGNETNLRSAGYGGLNLVMAG